MPCHNLHHEDPTYPPAYSALSAAFSCSIIDWRSAGKSTVAQQLVQAGYIDTYITLDDLTLLEAARSDPGTLLYPHQKI